MNSCRFEPMFRARGSALKQEETTSQQITNALWFRLPRMTQTLALSSLDLPIAGMTCAACAARLEKVLNRLPGVEATVNFAAERARLRIEGAETTPQRVVDRSEEHTSELQSPKDLV